MKFNVVTQADVAEALGTIQYLPGIYDVRIKLITAYNKKVIDKKPGIFASKKKKEEYENKTTIFGKIQIGQLKNLWIGKFVSNYNEEMLINLSNLINNPQTVGGWYTASEGKKT